MGWKFWKREQTEAEKRLEAVQGQGQGQGQAGAPVAPPPAPAPDPVVELTAGQRHMEQVIRELESLHGPATPPGEVGHFMLEVTSVRPADDGPLVLTGGAHEGGVEPGTVVGLMVVPADAADIPDDDPVAQDEALLGVRAAKATVVAWAADPPALVVTGLAADEVTVGSMVMH